MATNWAAARQEWKTGWLLVVAASIAQGVAITHFYTLGVFMKPLTEVYGWSRADVSFVQIFYSAVLVLFGPFVAMLADKVGPRPVALWGMAANCLTFALYGFALSDIRLWYAVGTLNAFAGLFCNAPVLTLGISRHFKAGLGLALAGTLAGGAVYTSSFLPFLAAYVIEAHDIQTAYFTLAGLGAVLSLPTLYLFYDRKGRASGKTGGTAASAAPAARLYGYRAREAFRQPRYWRLGLATLFVSLAVPAMVIHFVPIATDQGIDLTTAAAAAGLIGITAIFARIGTGTLLDMFPGRIVGAICFFLPVIAFLLLGLGAGMVSLILAAIVMGMALGAEVDVVSYLTNRYFGIRQYALIYSVLYAVFSVGAASGIALAGHIYDTTGSYDLALMLFAGSIILAAVLLFSLGRYPDFEERTH